MKILLFDIETSPNVGYTWGKYDQNVIDFQQQWQLLTFAYKWLDEKTVHVVTRKDFKDKTDRSIAKALHAVLSQADIVVAHNGDQFDNKKARAKFVEHGLGPTSPYRMIDTKKVAKRHFSFTSNKLDDLGKLLGVGRKVRIAEGFDLWLGCMAGNAASFATMARYNKQDVLLLERVYKKLLPWDNKHPHSTEHAHNCPKCGGLLQKRGIARTTTSEYQRFQCTKCGGWSRDRKALLNKKKGVVNL